MTTEQWARSFDIATAPTPPAVGDYHEPCPFTAREVAVRAVVLHGVVAAACGVDPRPVAEWYANEGVWDAVSPKEEAFLLDPSVASRDEMMALRWRQEAEWALLWVVGKVQHLGLPTRQCDTRRLVDEIAPALGSDLESFLAVGRVAHAGRATGGRRPALQPVVSILPDAPGAAAHAAVGPGRAGPVPATIRVRVARRDRGVGRHAVRRVSRAGSRTLRQSGSGVAPVTGLRRGPGLEVVQAMVGGSTTSRGTAPG